MVPCYFCGMTLLDAIAQHFSGTLLLRHFCGTLFLHTFLDTFVGHPCLILLRNTIVGDSALSLLWDAFTWHAYLTLLPDTIAQHSGGIFLFDTLVVHSYLTLLLGHPYLTCFLDTFVGCSYWTLWQGLRSHRPGTVSAFLQRKSACQWSASPQW